MYCIKVYRGSVAITAYTGSYEECMRCMCSSAWQKNLLDNGFTSWQLAVNF